MSVDFLGEYDPGFLDEMAKMTDSLRSMSIRDPALPELSELLFRSTSGLFHASGGSGGGIERIPYAERSKTITNEVLDISTDCNKEKFTRNVANSYESILYPPKLFTATVSGTLRNYPADLSEKDLFAALDPHGNIMELDCGQGNKKNPQYEYVLANNIVKKGNRGRPKKIREKSTRKVPNGSSGDKMQSQLTFLFISKERRNDKKTVHGFKEWKYLLFRKGKIHLAGLEADYMEENNKNINDIIDSLNKLLYPTLSPVEDADKVISLAKLKLNNVNYKFFLRINKGQFIHHKTLENVFRLVKAEDEKELQPGNCKCKEKFCRKCKIRKMIDSMSDVVADIKTHPLHPHPKICEVIPTRGNKLSIKIATPFPQKPNKYMRVEMFSASEIDPDYDKHMKIPAGTWGMRINIKGGLIFDGVEGEDYIKATYDFLLELFSRYYSSIVKNVTTPSDYIVENLYEDNIYYPNSGTINQLAMHARNLVKEHEVEKKIDSVISSFSADEISSINGILGGMLIPQDQFAEPCNHDLLTTRSDGLSAATVGSESG